MITCTYVYVHRSHKVTIIIDFKTKIDNKIWNKQQHQMGNSLIIHMGQNYQLFNNGSATATNGALVH